jgi:hypothetical protein
LRQTIDTWLLKVPEIENAQLKGEKSMKLKGKLLVSGLVALFVALMFGALVPLIVPGIYGLTDPVICPGDDVQAVVRKEHFSDRHGTGFSLHVDCVREDGRVVEEASMGLAFIVIVGAVFVPIFLLIFIRTFIPGKGASENQSPPYMTPQKKPSSSRRPDLSGKLEELAEARDAGLITDEEYDRKKQALLDDF